LSYFFWGAYKPYILLFSWGEIKNQISKWKITNKSSKINKKLYHPKSLKDFLHFNMSFCFLIFDIYIISQQVFFEKARLLQKDRF